MSMPSLTTSEFPKPRDDKEFEEMTRDLFAAHWKDDNTQVYGRSGQGQDGIDVYGQPNRADIYYGIQCKLRSQGILTQSDIEDEIKKARGFKHKIDTYIFVTTASRDKTTQDIIDQLSQNEQRQGGFKIQIRFWEDFCSLLAEHPRLIDKHYKSWAYPLKAQDESRVEHSLAIDKTSPLLVGLVVDLSRSSVGTMSKLPAASGMSPRRINEALNLVAEKSVAFCKTPESDDILPLLSLFALGYGFGTVRRTVSSILKQIGVKVQRLVPELIPADPVRDLFAETASKDSLPFTPNVAELNAHWINYRQSVEAQFMDVGLGQSILYDALLTAHNRISRELAQPYYKYPILLVISNGHLENASEEDLARIVSELRSLNVQIISLYVGEKTIAKKKCLYNTSPKTWPREALRMFDIASTVDAEIDLFTSIMSMVKEKEWEVPEKARMFLQLNQSDMLEEVINILLNPVKKTASQGSGSI
jgi:hypothetical protein